MPRSRSRSGCWLKLFVVHLQTSNGRLHSRLREKEKFGVCPPTFPYPYSGEGKLGAYCCTSEIPLNASSCPNNLFVACPYLSDRPCSSAAPAQKKGAEHLWIMETLSTPRFCKGNALFNGMSSSFRDCQEKCESKPACTYMSYW